MTMAVHAAMDFISALDQGSLGRLRATVAPGATWWVDAGPDRRGGDVTRTAGSGRFPLHGVMDLEEKLELMGQLGPSAFPTGCRQIPRRVVSAERACVIEVEGHGVHGSGWVYENRYAFVFDVEDDGRITSVREYLDTIHAQDVVGAGTEFPPRTALEPGDPRPPLDPSTVTSPEALLALALWPALAEGDIDTFESLFHPDATFWTDSGRTRGRGRLTGWGDARANGPFHGRIPIADKVAVMRERQQRAGYRTPGITVTPHRVIADGRLVAIEASGHAEFGDALYQNRYLWLVEVDGPRIRQVREYCDTLHVAELMGFSGEYDAPSSRPEDAS